MVVAKREKKSERNNHPDWQCVPMVCQKCTLVIYGCGEVSWTQGKTVTTQQLSGKKAFLYCYYMVLWCCIGGGGWWRFSSFFPVREAPTALLRLLRWKLWISYRRWRVAECILGWQYGVYYFLCSEIVVVVEKKSVFLQFGPLRTFSYELLNLLIILQFY